MSDEVRPIREEASVLGQLLLMQSVLCGLPDERSIFSFACRGLSFLPGARGVRHEPPERVGAGVGLRFPLVGSAQSWGEFVIDVGDEAQISVYAPYVRNFAAMIALILDERAQRALNRRYNEDLENRVRQRTDELLSEIADRRAVEEQLQRSRDMLALTLDAVPQAIFWKDTEGRYLGCNRVFAQVAGYNASADVLGKTDADLPWRPEDVAGYRDQDRYVLESGQPSRSTLEQLRRGDGDVRWVVTTKVPLRDASGKPCAVLGMFADVTEQRRSESERESLQNQLAQAQKMESVGRLAGGVAHDFNNMLQAILGNASLALIDPSVNSTVREHLEEILKAAERSASLTQQLLAFARKQTVAPRVLDLNRAVGSVLKMLQRLIGEDIHLEWQPTAELWPVKVDPMQIDQILANLVVNARDAIKGAGVIKISTNSTVLRAGEGDRPVDLALGDYVTLTVADSGCGISAEARAHLFEPFFTTKPAGKGTGLGLATVYGIVKQNRGAITVRSELGTGTAFTIYLPRSMPEATTTPRVAEERPLGGSETLLLVEDEEQILTLTKRILQQQGYVVLTASHPEHALRLAEQHPGPIHLLITDVIMPGMNGRDLLTQLRKVKPGVRCLLMSGYTADILASDARGQTATPFLPKPFTGTELSARIRHVLDQPAAGDPGESKDVAASARTRS